MKKRSEGFLRDEIISHESEQFDYIRELHSYLWKFIRCEIPDASGHFADYIDEALRLAQSRFTEVVRWQDAKKELPKKFYFDESQRCVARRKFDSGDIIYCIAIYNHKHDVWVNEGNGKDITPDEWIPIE